MWIACSVNAVKVKTRITLGRQSSHYSESQDVSSVHSETFQVLLESTEDKKKIQFLE